MNDPTYGDDREASSSRTFHAEKSIYVNDLTYSNKFQLMDLDDIEPSFTLGGDGNSSGTSRVCYSVMNDPTRNR